MDLLFLPVGIICPFILAGLTIQSDSWEACPGFNLSLIGCYLAFVLGVSNCIFLPIFIHFDKEKKKRKEEEKNQANQQINQAQSMAPPSYQPAPITINNNVGMTPQQQQPDQNQFTF